MGHTPGPWQIAVEHHTAYVEPVTPVRPLDEGVARVIGNTSHEMFGAETMANARLLAAAPDMLEALQSIAELDASYCDYDLWTLRQAVSQYKAAAKAAIAKATGAKT